MVDHAVPALQKRFDSIVEKASQIKVLVTLLANWHALKLAESSSAKYVSFFYFNFVFLFSSHLSKDFFGQSYFEFLANLIITGDGRYNKRAKSEEAHQKILNELLLQNAMVSVHFSSLVFLFFLALDFDLFFLPILFVSLRAHVQPPSFRNDLTTFEFLNRLCFASLETYWRMKSKSSSQRKSEQLLLEPSSEFCETFSKAVNLLDVEEFSKKQVKEFIDKLKVPVLSSFLLAH